MYFKKGVRYTPILLVFIFSAHCLANELPKKVEINFMAEESIEYFGYLYTSNMPHKHMAFICLHNKCLINRNHLSKCEQCGAAAFKAMEEIKKIAKEARNPSHTPNLPYFINWASSDHDTSSGEDCFEEDEIDRISTEAVYGSDEDDNLGKALSRQRSNSHNYVRKLIKMRGRLVRSSEN